MLGFLKKLKDRIRIRTRIRNEFANVIEAVNPFYEPMKIGYENVFGRFHKKIVIFIIGVQRSGTTAMFYNLAKDDRVKSYGEFSELSLDGDEKLRLHPLARLKKQLRQNVKPILLLKPLVESQNSKYLLNNIPNSRAIWMYRHYKDVANSNLKKFGIGNGINNLTPLMVEDYTNWRADGVSKVIRDIVKIHFSAEMNPYDAAALFWYIRSRFYFDLGLNKMNEVLLIRYEDFAMSPNKYLSKIYDHIKLEAPENLQDNTIHNRSIKKGKNVILSSEIEELCENLYQKFEQEFNLKN
jgi:hypothetical protein